MTTTFQAYVETWKYIIAQQQIHNQDDVNLQHLMKESKLCGKLAMRNRLYVWKRKNVKLKNVLPLVKNVFCNVLVVEN